MKSLRALACLVIVFGAASGAWAQYGLSGAPELLRLGPDARDPGSASPYGITAVGATDVGGAYGPPQSDYPSLQPPASQPSPPPSWYSGRAAYPAAGYTASSPRYQGPYDAGYASRPPQGGAAASGPPLAPIPGTTPSQASSPSVMNQMMDESGFWGTPAYAGPGNGCGFGQPCGEPCGPCYRPQWYFQGAGLFLTRGDKANCLWTTYETNNNPNQLMRFNDARLDWQGGFEFRIGRRFGACDQWAIEADYWRIDGLRGFASSTVPGGSVSTPLIISDIEFAGVNGTAYFDGASVHRIWRNDRFENAEINLIRTPILPGGECCPVDLQWSVGFRYFRFDESLVFESETATPEFAYLSDRIYNNLFGVQMGLETGFRLGYNWRAFAASKLGLYDNHIENTFDAYRGDGVRANPTAASGMIGTYPVVASKDQFSFLAQIDAGLEWRFHPQWKAFAGYRLIAATGIGLADHQFITYVVDIPELGRIKSNGDLILHGGFAGLEYRF